MKPCIIKVWPDGAERQRSKPLPFRFLEGDGVTAQHALLEQASQNIAQLDLIQLLVTTQGDQEWLFTPVFHSSQQQKHLDDLGGMPSLDLAEGFNASLSRRLHRGGLTDLERRSVIRA